MWAAVKNPNYTQADGKVGDVRGRRTSDSSFQWSTRSVSECNTEFRAEFAAHDNLSMNHSLNERMQP